MGTSSPNNSYITRGRVALYVLVEVGACGEHAFPEETAMLQAFTVLLLDAFFELDHLADAVFLVIPARRIITINGVQHLLLELIRQGHFPLEKQEADRHNDQIIFFHALAHIEHGRDGHFAKRFTLLTEQLLTNVHRHFVDSEVVAVLVLAQSAYTTLGFDCADDVPRTITVYYTTSPPAHDESPLSVDAVIIEHAEMKTTVEKTIVFIYYDGILERRSHMPRNIKILHLEMVGRSIIQIDSGARFNSITELCNDRALRKLSHILVHKIADLPYKPLKMERPVDMMAALIAARMGTANCGPGTDGATVVDVFYNLIEDQACIEDLIHGQLLPGFVQAYTRRFIRWYGPALQARGVVLEG